MVSWSWGMSNSGSTHGGGGAGADKVSMQDFNVTKYQDKATVKLLQSCANGEHIPEATLVLRKAGASLEHRIIKMTNILVSSISTGGCGGEDRLTENVSLNFSKVNVAYIKQKPTGEPGKTLENELGHSYEYALI